MPDPTRTPKRVGSTLSVLRAASSTAMVAQATAYLRKGSNLRSSFLSMYLRGSNPFSSPAMRVGKSVASKRVMGPMPERPSRRPAQNSSAVLPRGVTAPTPVITTRRLSMAIDGINGPLLILLDIADRVTHRGDLLRVLVGDLEVELLLEGHDQLDRVERIGAQILDELRVGVDLVLFDPELLDDDLLHPLLDRLCHEHPPLPRELNSLHRCRRPPGAACYMYRPPLTCIVCPVI